MASFKMHHNHLGINQDSMIYILSKRAYDFSSYHVLNTVQLYLKNDIIDLKDKEVHKEWRIL